MTSSRLHTYIAIIVVALACATGCSTQNETERAGVTTTTQGGAPLDDGPYEVGRTTLMLGPGTQGRSYTTDIWYPAQSTQGAELATSEFIPGISATSERAYADVPVADGGPYPVIVYSHGSGGTRYIASFVTEQLASYGFIVVSADHAGNTAIDMLTGASSPVDTVAYNRIVDTSALLDQIETLNGDQNSTLYNTMDTTRVGVVGHSFGGFTALGMRSGYASIAGVAPADTRVDAVVAMAPAAGLLTAEQLAEVDVPTLVISGTMDDVTPVDPNTELVWEHVTGRPLWRVDINRAGHQSFTDICSYQQQLTEMPDAPALLVDTIDTYAEDGCAADMLDIEEAQQIINDATVAFALTYIAEQPGYSHVLSDERGNVTANVKE